jgi:hypothetical protein
MNIIKDTKWESFAFSKDDKVIIEDFKPPTVAVLTFKTSTGTYAYENYVFKITYEFDKNKGVVHITDPYESDATIELVGDFLYYSGLKGLYTVFKKNQDEGLKTSV